MDYLTLSTYSPIEDYKHLDYFLLYSKTVNNELFNEAVCRGCEYSISASRQPKDRSGMLYCINQRLNIQGAPFSVFHNLKTVLLINGLVNELARMRLTEDICFREDHPSESSEPTNGLTRHQFWD